MLRIDILGMNGCDNPRQAAERLAYELGVQVFVYDHQLVALARSGHKWANGEHALVLTSQQFSTFEALWSELLRQMQAGMPPR